MTLLSFNSDPKIKAKYLRRVRAHAKADEIIHGTYWRDGKGCAVGCTIHSGDHNRYETELGLPAWLARLEDMIFEGLPNGEAKAFPEVFLSAIPVGADLDPIRDRFCEAIQRENLARVEGLAISDALKTEVTAAIRTVIELHAKAAVDPSAAWSAAESAAWSARSAARSAAESAARSAAESAAWSAAWSARSAWSAAESAAWSAAESAAWSAAWSAKDTAYLRYRDILLDLLRKAGEPKHGKDAQS